MKIGRGIYLRGHTYWLNFQEKGERHYISLETSDPVEAVRRSREMRECPVLAPRSDFQTEIDRYLSHKLRLNIFSRATERVTRAALQEFSDRVDGVPLRDVRPAAVEEHYRALQERVAETTAQIHMRSLRAFFNWASQERIIRHSPFGDLKLAKIDHYARLRFCTATQRDGLIKSAPTDDLRFILFAGFDSGMRKNEIIEARVDWFDLGESGAVHIKNTDTFRIKDRETRFVPLTGRFREFLRVYLAGMESDAFALKPDVKHGKSKYRYDFHRPYNDYMTDQKMDWVTAHVMRHTFASLLVQAGVSIYKVARWIGDGVEVVEKHYAHLAPQDPDIERMLVAT